MKDNERILRLVGKRYPHKEAIEARLAIGLERYGHGIRVEDDTTQWGTKTDSWLEMGLEEIDDLVIYITAALCRTITIGLERGSTDNIWVTEFNEIIETLSGVREQLSSLIESGE